MSSKPRPTAQDIKVGLDRPAIKNEQPVRGISDPTHETFMIISLDKLRPFEDNPRKTRNPLYDELKASIKARGLDNPPSITKRPHQDFYIIANGGNTRLAILNELYKETGNASFYNIPCLFKPWQDETNVLLGHLIENETRGELTFIEKALGFAQIKVMYEKADAKAQPHSKPLSLKAFSERLEAGGYRISTSQLSRMFECINSLLPALRRTLEGGLGKHKIEALLKLKSYLNRIWNKYTSEDDRVFLELWLTKLYAFDLGYECIDLDNIKDTLLGELAAQLRQEYQTLQMDLSLLYKNLSIDEADNAGAPGLAFNLQDDLESETRTQTTPSKPLLSVVPPAQSPKVGMTPHANNDSVSVNEGNTPEGDQATTPALTHAPHEAPVSSSDHFAPEKNENERLSNIRQQLASLDAQTLADTADILDSPTALREHIALLALNIAEWGQVKGVIQTREGLGFTFTERPHSNAPRACSAALLLKAVLNLQPAPKDAAEAAGLAPALFRQLLIGSDDITIGAQPTLVLERLPDAVLDTVFQLIWMARRLVDLSREENP